MSSLSLYFRRRSTYPLQWLILLLLLCIPLGRYLWTQIHLPRRDHSATETLTGRPGVDWFLILHLPEITTQYESGKETMRTRFNEWLAALDRAGYRPMLLSEVYARLERDQCLPEKTLVLFFSPAYKTTFDLVQPLLAGRQMPAVLLTDERALDQMDRRFITFEETRRMKKSGLWDVGFLDKEDRFRLNSHYTRALQFGSKEAKAWTPEVGALAANWGPARENLTYLTLIADLTAEDLINRLRAETPVQDPVALVTGPIQNRDWGMAASTAAAAGLSFNLEAPLDKKSARLFWLLTRHRPDFSLEMQTRSRNGAVWLRLRYDEDSGDGVFVSLSGSRVTVRQRQNKVWHRLYTAAGNGSRIRVDLRGSQMTLSVNGKSASPIRLLPDPPPANGIVELYVDDTMRGVARARGVQMIYTPHISAPGSAS